MNIDINVKVKLFWKSVACRHSFPYFMVTNSDIYIYKGFE